MLARRMPRTESYRPHCGQHTTSEAGGARTAHPRSLPGTARPAGRADIGARGLAQDRPRRPAKGGAAHAEDPQGREGGWPPLRLAQPPAAYCIRKTRLMARGDRAPAKHASSVRVGEVPLSYDAVSGVAAMRLAHLLTGTVRSPRGSGSCGGMLLVMLALSGLLTPRRRSRSTPSR